jgi:hypothetical protein
MGAKSAFIRFSGTLVADMRWGNVAGVVRAGVDAIAASDAFVIIYQHEAILSFESGVDRADRNAWRIDAVHANGV